MARLADKVIYSMIGACSGLGGIASAGNCTGSCSTCYGFVGAGALIILFLAIHRMRKKPDPLS